MGGLVWLITITGYKRCVIKIGKTQRVAWVTSHRVV